MEVEYIAISKAMSGFLPFFYSEGYLILIKIQRDAPKVLCSIFKKTVTFHEYNQGPITLTDAPQIRPRIKHIAIKYQHFHGFVENGDIKIKHFDTKEHIEDIL